MPVFLLGWYPDYVDPDNYTAAFAGTSGSKGKGIYFSNQAVGRPVHAGADHDEGRGAQGDLREGPEDVDGRGPDGSPLPGQPASWFPKKNVTGVKIGPPLIFHYNQLKFTK